MPTGHRHLVKGFTLTNASAATREVSIYVVGVAGADFIPFWRPMTVEETIAPVCYFVLEPGDECYVLDSGSGAGAVSINLSLHGVDFTL